MLNFIHQFFNQDAIKNFPFSLLAFSMSQFICQKKMMMRCHLIFLLGGVTLLRAAAKNHMRVSVICDPEDYNRYPSP